MQFALLSKKQPKTRQIGPRHQAAKLDVPDLLAVVGIAFGDLPEPAKLWAQTGQTFKPQVREVLRELGLPTETSNGIGMKALDVGSLRSGGCTWHLQATEDSELCRRKGRWLSQRVMEIYAHEATERLYLKKISTTSRQKVLDVANLLPVLLACARKLKDAKVPTRNRFSLLHQEGLWRNWG